MEKDSDLVLYDRPKIIIALPFSFCGKAEFLLQFKFININMFINSLQLC